MTDYQRIILAGPTVDGPPDLPAALVGLADTSLADLSVALNPCPAEYAGIGYWPIQPAEPTPEGKVAVGRAPALVEGGIQWVEELADAPPPSTEAIDVERDHRVSAGFTFGGVVYQSRPEDRENVTGASLAALAAMMNGAQPGDYRWHGGDSDFMWIAADNTVHAMDAQTVFAFGQTAMAHKTAMIFAARAIKDANPIPAHFTDDGYWP